jgi:tRNA threonylcarbamoyladenosine biosynthesis protein TsaB
MKPIMNSCTVLALDLSTARGMVSLWQDGQPLFEATFQSERSHNAQVFVPLAEALTHVAENGNAVVVVGTGPGSYTGVRIGIAAAQGVGLSRGWPVIGWPSICTASLKEYSVLGDARRGMFYHARVQDGHLVQAPLIVTQNQAAKLVEQGGDWVSFDPRPPLGLDDIPLLKPDAGRLCQIMNALPDQNILDLTKRPLEPSYLQEAFITTARKAGKQVPAMPQG